MRSEEYFALAARIIGVVILFYGVINLLDGALLQLGYFRSPDTTPGYFVIMGLAWFFAGIYLTRGASLLVKFAYGLTKEDDENDDEEGDIGPAESDRP